MRTLLLRALCACALAPLAGVAAGEAYPVKPVRIVTTVPGGSLDLTARVIAPRLSARLGQPVIVDNRGGILSMELVAKAPADGYTLLIASGSLWTSQFFRNDVSWDPLRDYTPVALLVTSPNILVVHPSLPARSARELIALAKSRAGEINYSSGQTGSSSHIAGALFGAMADVKIVRIAYKGLGPAMLALVTGETQVSFPNAASVTPFMRSGRVRALAVTSAQPSPLAPGLPTMAAAGLPGYESKATNAMFAPARTPAAIVERLTGEIIATLTQPPITRRFFDAGAEVAAAAPATLVAEMKSDMKVMGKVLKGIGAEGR